MTEYWLQKKTIGGWSHVTWYDSYEQAKFNFDNVSKGNSGYSWRIVKAEMVEEKLLQETTPIEAPNTKLETAKANVWAGSTPNAIGEWSDTPKPDSVKSEHGMTGKVWMIHHQKKLRARVPENSIEQYQKDGYEFGGPKTAFRS